MKTRGGRRKRGATLLGERRAARSQARAEAAPAAERRERGAERRGLRARRNVNQIPAQWVLHLLKQKSKHLTEMMLFQGSTRSAKGNVQGEVDQQPREDFNFVHPRGELEFLQTLSTSEFSPCVPSSFPAPQESPHTLQ